MTKLRLAWFLSLTIATFTAFAQEDEAPNPRLSAAPEMCAWSIDYQYKRAELYPATSNPVDMAIQERMKKAHPVLMKINVIKAGQKRLETYEYADNSKTLKWIVGDNIITDMRVNHAISMTNSLEAGISFKKDFYDLDWILSAKYLGHKSLDGTECAMYASPSAPDGPGLIAYIDLKSAIPVRIETPDTILSYRFAPSAEQIVLPSKVTACLQTTAAP